MDITGSLGRIDSINCSLFTVPSTILIIEDDIFFGDALLQKVRSGGYDAFLARDGVSGLKELRDRRPDLVLLDIVLPKMTGYDVLEAKQKDPGLAHIPVIVISRSGEPAEVNRALSFGVKDYVVKSEFDPEEVMEKVRLQLSGKDISVAVKAPENPPLKAKPPSSPGLSGKKIMWVEDDKFLSDIIARKLSAHGCVLLHAAEGESALKMLEKEHPDLVLLDILLSGIDGFEILKRIKSNEKIRKTPVILLSNLGQKEDIEKGESLGAARFLVKATVTLDEIIAEIQKVLQEAGSK